MLIYLNRQKRFLNIFQHRACFKSVTQMRHVSTNRSKQNVDAITGLMETASIVMVYTKILAFLLSKR